MFLVSFKTYLFDILGTEFFQIRTYRIFIPVIKLLHSVLIMRFANNLAGSISAANKRVMDKEPYKSKFAIILHNARIFQLFRGAVRSAFSDT